MTSSTEPASGDAKRRKHPRAPIELKVEYKKMNTFFSDYTKNISKGGTFIKTDRPLPVGTEFVFKLFVPALPKPIELRGRVVWHNTATDMQRPDQPSPGMGISFIYQNDDDRQTFEGAVEKMMRASLGDRIYDRLLGNT